MQERDSVGGNRSWGINRSQSGLRTAPSSQACMDIDLYLAMANGVWIYDPKTHSISQSMPPGAKLAQRLNLKPTQAIYFAQSVGYPIG
jgi:hypothetical protein